MDRAAVGEEDEAARAAEAYRGPVLALDTERPVKDKTVKYARALSGLGLNLRPAFQS